MKDASGAQPQVPFSGSDALGLASGDRTWERAAKAAKELRARMHAEENARKRKPEDSSVELEEAELEELE